MKSRILILVALFVISAGSAFAQVTTDITATANVITQLELNKESDVNFGNISQNSNPEINVVAQTQTDVGTVFTEGEFIISGGVGAQVTVSWPAATQELTGGSGDPLEYTIQVAKVDNASENRGLLTNGSQVTLIDDRAWGTDGQATLFVGGTLDNITTQTGTFSNTEITFSVEYN